jgi:hypothetical protein
MKSFSNLMDTWTNKYLQNMSLKFSPYINVLSDDVFFVFHTNKGRSWYSDRVMNWMAKKLELDSWQGQDIFPFLHGIHNGSGTHPASYLLGSRGCHQE